MCSTAARVDSWMRLVLQSLAELWWVQASCWYWCCTCLAWTFDMPPQFQEVLTHVENAVGRAVPTMATSDHHTAATMEMKALQ